MAEGLDEGDGGLSELGGLVGSVELAGELFVMCAERIAEFQPGADGFEGGFEEDGIGDGACPRGAGKLGLRA